MILYTTVITLIILINNPNDPCYLNMYIYNSTDIVVVNDDSANNPEIQDQITSLAINTSLNNNNNIQSFDLNKNGFELQDICELNDAYVVSELHPEVVSLNRSGIVSTS